MAEAIDEEGNGSISSILSRFQDLLYIILSHLSIKDLHRAARVNVTWSQVVQNIKRSRQQIGWCEYNELEPSGVEIQIGQAIDNLTSEPRYVLIFTSRELQKRMFSLPPGFRSSARSLPRAVKQTKSSFSGFIEQLFPVSCHIMNVITNETIGTSFSCNRIVDNSSNGSTASASCLFLPKLRNVDIYPFMLRGTLDDILDMPNSGDKGGHHAASRNTSDDDCINKKESKNPVTGIPHDKCQKLILLFLTSTDYTFYHTFDCRKYPNVVIAGGFVDSPTFDGTKCKKQDYELSGLGIAFCGGSDLRVASVALGMDIYNEMLVEMELLRLEAAHLPGNQSVAFMFSTSIRDKHFFGGIKNVESETFRKLFPNTPLLGFLTSRQIGYDLLPGCEDMKNKSAASNYPFYTLPEHCHSNATVFVMISFP